LRIGTNYPFNLLVKATPEFRRYRLAASMPPAMGCLAARTLLFRQRRAPSGSLRYLAVVVYSIAMTAIPRLSLSQQIAWQAEFIVNNIQQTDYQHVDNIDVDRGVYDCDCNGFVGFVLGRVAPDHYAMIPKEADQLRPRAFKYYEFFSSLTPESTGGWHQIDFLRDARRGDIIAWRFPEIELGQNTGHVFFVADTAVMIDSGVFAIRAYDSAAVPHFDDTRGDGEGQFPTGVGSGFINFTVSDTGAPVAFQFGPSEDQFVTLPIAIGRVEPLP
jgi:hypothetical protein